MIRRLPVVVLWILTASYLLSLFTSSYWWIADLLTNFQVYFLVGFLFLLLIFIFRRSKASGIVCGAFVLIILFRLYPFWFGSTDEANGQMPVRIITMNLLSSNSSVNQVERFVIESRADMIFLMEITPQWEEIISGWKEIYPYQTIHARRDNFGIALLSKRPPTNTEVVHAGLAALPSVIADFNTDNGDFRFIGTHPLPPVSALAWKLRNDQFIALNSIVRKSGMPVILGGDFNSSSFSPHFSSLLQNTSLRDSRNGQGIQTTWHAAIPFLEIALDHLLISEGVIIQKRFTGPNIGSDHRPVILDFSVE